MASKPLTSTFTYGTGRKYGTVSGTSSYLNVDTESSPYGTRPTSPYGTRSTSPYGTRSTSPKPLDNLRQRLTSTDRYLTSNDYSNSTYTPPTLSKNKDVAEFVEIARKLQTIDLDAVQKSFESFQSRHEDGNSKEEVIKLKDEYGVLEETCKNFEKKCMQAVEDKSEYEEKFKRIKDELRNKEKEVEHLERVVADKDRELKHMAKDKESALSRLSKEMGDKLSQDNPAIADLSDPNRSTKIAEMYNSIYDNEWTDALETLQSTRLDEEHAVIALLEIMKTIYQFCSNVKKEHVEQLENHLLRPMTKREAWSEEKQSTQSSQKQIRSLLMECIKLGAKDMIPSLQKEMSYKRNDTHSRTVGPGRASNLYDFLSPSSESTYNHRATSPHADRSHFDTHSKPITRREVLSRDHQTSPTISSEGETNEHDRHDRITSTRKVYLSSDKKSSPNVTIENDRTKRRSSRESSNVDQLISLVKDLQKVDIDTIESSLKDTTTEQLKSELQKQAEEYNTLKEVYDESTKKYQEAVDANDGLVTKAKQLIKDAKEKARTESEETIKQLKMRLKAKETELANIKSEKDSALSRLSKEMGDKLSENNAGIADLSDPNRSTKLAEKYNNLYDNDWTDALESLTTEGRVDEEAGVRFLLEIMKNASTFCKRAYMKALQSLECILSNPVSSNGQPTDISARSGEDKQISQMLETCVKLKAKTAILNLQKSYMASSHKPLYAERLPEYVNKCIEICWLMNTHNPPLEFAEPPMCGQPYDKDSYKEFTKQGDTVSFVVWLPLLIERDGAILTKGVVQPIAKSFSTSVSEKKRNTSADKTKVKVRPEKDDERLQHLLYNKEVEQKDSYEHYQSKDAENKFSDLIGEGRHQQYTTDYNTKYGEDIDRPGVNKNEHHLNEMFQDSKHRPYSANVRSPTNYESKYKYSPEPATKKYTGYRQSEHYNRPHSAITERHTDYDYKHERPKTAAVESKGNAPTYFDPKSAEIYQHGRTKFALYQNQMYVHDRVSDAWQLSSGFDT